MRAVFSSRRFALAFVILSAGCFRGVHPSIEKIKCRADKNCPEHTTCLIKDGSEFGSCISENADAGAAKNSGDSAAKLDGAVAEVASDSKRPDVGGASDAYASPDTTLPQTADASQGGDAPLAIDAPSTPDDAVVVAADTAADVPYRVGDAVSAGDTASTGDAAQADTAPPCNGGCCSNAQCPPSAPVCNSANKCVGCTADVDCQGRSLTACNTASGACVQCTKKEQCSGTNAACNLTTNTCVGCTQRSDCPGNCQTCSNQTCVPVKNADDPSKCPGTCDGAGECRAKKGQKCSSVTGGCLSGLKCAPDDTCCDRDCTGSCEACNLASAPGTCTVLAKDSKPQTGHAACAGTGTCAGTCQGAADGSCTFPTDSCGATSCTGTTFQDVGQCNQGTCSMPSPVSCKTGATCSAGICACPAGWRECGSSCVNLDSDPKNCGKCGHDCLGGPCEAGSCKPYKLADVATGQPWFLSADGAKVYAMTQPMSMNDETKIWQMDSVTPGSVTEIKPSRPEGVFCVLDGTIVWPMLGEDGTLGYCSVSGCEGSTKKFSHPVPSTGFNSMEAMAACDTLNKEVVWLESNWVDSYENKTYSVWRSSPTGANVRQMTSFNIITSSTTRFNFNFPVGRASPLVYTMEDETSAQTYSLVTTTKDALPALLVAGEKNGPADLSYAPLYGNDNILMWTTGGNNYQAPVTGVGVEPTEFYLWAVVSGIMDNHHFYGFFENKPGVMQWCVASNCSPTPLSKDFPEGRAYTQDAVAMYWTVLDLSHSDGFSIWKVAKQAY